jgi:hypothetical protein
MSMPSNGRLRLIISKIEIEKDKPHLKHIALTQVYDKYKVFPETYGAGA